MPEEGAVLRTALEIAVFAARSGGDAVRQNAGSDWTARSKSSAIDLVTEVDVASGVAVARAILDRVPDAKLLVEEPEVHELVGVPPASLTDDELWVVDPLDGTTSFVHGYPCYSVAVALVRGGQPVAGAVYNIALNEINAAAVGEGATRNGKPIHCTGAAGVREALLVTGFPYDRGEPLDRQLRVLAAFLRAPVHGIRRDGSAAIDCCHVASGRCDGFWEYALKPWDMAAGVVIAREAGAHATDTDGTPWTVSSGGIVVANAALHAEMIELILAADD
jgi:myo-inositol-1(or 4)-monophosphatase